MNVPPEDSAEAVPRFASEVRFFGGTGNMLNVVGVKDAHLVGLPAKGLNVDHLNTEMHERGLSHRWR